MARGTSCGYGDVRSETVGHEEPGDPLLQPRAGRFRLSVIAYAVEVSLMVSRSRQRDDPLIAAARRARRRAHAPFSGFTVGAALETAAGDVVTGCNLENATFGLTMCAERVALFTALSEGHRSFRRLAVVADTRDPTPPCGACRQLLWEFGHNLEVTLANLARVTGRYRLSDLLPSPFDARLLHAGPRRPSRSGRRRLP